jgi:hypothetical protein
MGNTLTGLTPATTYDALIKVGDNSPVDGTLKQLSDGLGNDIPISVSTSSINLTGTATVGGVAIANTTQLAAKQDTLVSGTNIKTINSTSILGSGDVLIDKTSIGLGNVVNVDTTNASNISSGTLSDSRLSSTVTKQGNTFNGASQLVQLDASSKLPAVDGSQLTNLSPGTLPNNLLKIASVMSSTLQTVSDYLNNLGVLQLSNRRVGVLQDSGVTTQTSSVIQATATNANLVIAPNGTGALIASIPDGTATGGNARGNDAVDLQIIRNTATNVASGNFSTILGGESNTTSSAYSVVSGGQSNIASTNTHATVVGGQSNTASGQKSVTGGTFNISSGTWSTSFGNGNTSSGQQSVTLGAANTASVTSGVAIGTANSTNLSGIYGISLGAESNAYIRGQQTLASEKFTVGGDAQQSLITARNSSALTSGATLILSLDGTGISSLIIPNGNNRAWNVTIDTISVVTAITGTATGVSVGNCYSETKKLLFKRIGGTSSIVGTVDTSAIKSDLGMATASITISAGGSQQMAITFTAPTFVGGGSVTCRVVSKVMLVEVAY